MASCSGTYVTVPMLRGREWRGGRWWEMVVGGGRWREMVGDGGRWWVVVGEWRVGRGGRRVRESKCVIVMCRALRPCTHVLPLEHHHPMHRHTAAPPHRRPAPPHHVRRVCLATTLRAWGAAPAAPGRRCGQWRHPGTCWSAVGCVQSWCCTGLEASTSLRGGVQVGPWGARVPACWSAAWVAPR